MQVKIADLMATQVVSAQPHQSVEHVRGILQRCGIHALPVVGPDDEAVGIVSSTDLAADLKNGTPVSQIMTEDVKTVPAYNDVSIAARIMRKHHIHHVVVTHEKRVVGIISSYDLLKLVEGHRFTAKAAPTATKKKR